MSGIMIGLLTVGACFGFGVITYFVGAGIALAVLPVGIGILVVGAMNSNAEAMKIGALVSLVGIIPHWIGHDIKRGESERGLQIQRRYPR